MAICLKLREGIILGGNGEITVEWEGYWNEFKTVSCAEKEAVLC